MSILSKEYLQSLPNQLKIWMMNENLGEAALNIKHSAIRGNTFYIYNIKDEYLMRDNVPLGIYPNNATKDEYIDAFNRMFPNCFIIYQEKSDITILNPSKRSILVDWS